MRVRARRDPNLHFVEQVALKPPEVVIDQACTFTVLLCWVIAGLPAVHASPQPLIHFVPASPSLSPAMYRENTGSSMRYISQRLIED